MTMRQYNVLIPAMIFTIVAAIAVPNLAGCEQSRERLFARGEMAEIKLTGERVMVLDDNGTYIRVRRFLKTELVDGDRRIKVGSKYEELFFYPFEIQELDDDGSQPR